MFCPGDLKGRIVMREQKTYIRVATVEDAEEILKIYAPYVKKTAITFEYDVPSLPEFRDRIRKTLEKYPFIVVVNEGEILGYAYTGHFVGRRAYDWSAETTIYVKEENKKMGLGRMLYQALEDISKLQNIINLNVCIGYPEGEDEYLNQNSVQFHKHLGYSLVGEFHKCGYKFGRWYNMVWMEKMIGKHTASPPTVIPFPELDKDALAMIKIKR